MTQRVVDLLQSIDVDEDHSELSAAAPRTREAVNQAIGEQRAVRKSSESVVQGLMRELLLHLLTRGEVQQLREEIFRLPRLVAHQSQMTRDPNRGSVGPKVLTLAFEGVVARGEASTHHVTE